MSCLTYADGDETEPSHRWSDMNIDEVPEDERAAMIESLNRLAEEMAEIRAFYDTDIPGAMRWRPEDGKVL